MEAIETINFAFASPTNNQNNNKKGKKEIRSYQGIIKLTEKRMMNRLGLEEREKRREERCE